MRTAATALLLLLATTPALAASPTVDATSVGDSVAATTHSPTLPACASGKLLVIHASIDNNQTPTANWTAGWTQLVELTGDSQVDGVVRYKFATGSDTLSFDTNGSATVSYIVRCYGGAHASSAPEIGTVSQPGATLDPDPPSVTASWGAEDNLFCPFTVYDSGGVTITIDTTHSDADTTNGYPINYTTDARDQAVASAAGVASVCRPLTATATADPGTFRITASDRIYAATIVIRPAAATQSQSPRSMHQYRLRR